VAKIFCGRRGSKRNGKNGGLFGLFFLLSGLFFPGGYGITLKEYKFLRKTR
jgi:hypothetical protein